MLIKMPESLQSGAFVSLDPAVGQNKKAGIAYWQAGRLRANGAIKIGKRSEDETDGARCVRIAGLLLGWCSRVEGFNARALVFEWPQMYGVGVSQCDPNTLTPLAGVGCALAGMLQALLALPPHNTGLEVVSLTPREWSEGISKTTTGDPWESPRGNLVKSQCSEDEYKLIVPSHDAIDAVAIGLAALGRFIPKPKMHRGPSVRFARQSSSLVGTPDPTTQPDFDATPDLDPADMFGDIPEDMPGFIDPGTSEVAPISPD